jgi:organic radical activating enzyme
MIEPNIQQEILTKERQVLADVRDELNKTGCGFCLAKWTQVTIHLQMGQTHSCHHPATHKIPVHELKRNPSALHNTKFKKEKRKEMLEGKRPSECDYCWNVEDNSNEFSDRVYKSNEPWSKPFLEEVKELGWRGDYNPKYVEVAFSNACNFKCSYCGPSFSSQWVQEVKKFGGYPTDDNFNNPEWLEENDLMPIHHKDYNPYVEAFWRWWPDLYRDLHTFRITGGEPLLAPDTWKVLDYIIDNPEPNRELKLGINSNLGVPDELVNKLIEKIQIIEDNDLVKELVIYTSCDTAGNHADYIRNGLDYDKWVQNVDKVLRKSKKLSMVCMSTFNALSIPRYKELIDFGYKMKQEHNSELRYWCPAFIIDSSYLRHPSHQAVRILDADVWSPKVRELASYAETLRDSFDWWGPDKTAREPLHEFKNWYIGYTDIEINKIKRIADWMETKIDENELVRTRKNFYRFMKAHDERRGTNFKETFPEFAEFYDNCGILAQG